LNFGTIEIDWKQNYVDTRITIQVRNVTGHVVLETSKTGADLSLPAAFESDLRICEPELMPKLHYMIPFDTLRWFIIAAIAVIVIGLGAVLVALVRSKFVSSNPSKRKAD
jgi:hypothetical protein